MMACDGRFGPVRSTPLPCASLAQFVTPHFLVCFLPPSLAIFIPSVTFRCFSIAATLITSAPRTYFKTCHRSFHNYQSQHTVSRKSIDLPLFYRTQFQTHSDNTLTKEESNTHTLTELLYSPLNIFSVFSIFLGEETNVRDKAKNRKQKQKKNNRTKKHRDFPASISF